MDAERRNSKSHRDACAKHGGGDWSLIKGAYTHKSEGKIAPMHLAGVRSTTLVNGRVANLYRVPNMSLADESFIYLIALFWRDGVNQKRRLFINSNKEYYLYTQRMPNPNTSWLTLEVTS